MNTEPLQIVITNDSLSHEEVDEAMPSNLICKTRDGLFHRVMSLPFPFCKPEGKQRVIRAIRKLYKGQTEILVEIAE